MNPEKDSILVEVLDRLLDRGAILNADLIISVAGIPLIGLNLRAALASMETMLEYGIMEDWDRSCREWYTQLETQLPLFPGEQVLFKAFGYLRQEQGLVKCWVPGIWNITSERLILWIKTPGEILFETPLNGLCASRMPSSHETRKELELSYPDGRARISLSEGDKFEFELAKASRSREPKERICQLRAYTTPPNPGT
jgi:hypothetical protein